MAAPPIGYNDPTIGGLVGWWTMNEGTGTNTTADLSGNGNTGYLTNSPAWTNGVVGSALKFNGTSQFIYVPTNSVFTIVTNLTVSSWCNWFGGSSENCIVDRYYSYSTTILGSSGNIKIYFKSSASWATSIIAPQNKWINISWTITASSLNLYTNGILAASTNSSGGSLSTSNNVIGIGSIGPGGLYFNGFIDDVRIYNRALSSDEILKLYNGGYGSQK
jgi:hypothetical protein